MIPLPKSADEDATAAIQARLDRGGLVRMQGRAVYTVRRPLVVRSDTDWLLDDDVEIVRGYDGRGEAHALVQCLDAANVSIRGLRCRARDASCRGKLLHFNRVAGVRFDRLTFGQCYADWSTAIKDCCDGVATTLRFACGGGLYQDGFHLYGGRDWLVSDLEGEGGDDLFAGSNEKAGDGGFGETLPLENIRVMKIRGTSTHANLVRIRRVDGAHPVRNITVCDVAGACLGVGGIAIEGAPGYPVEDVTLSQVELDCSRNQWEGVQLAHVQGAVLDRVRVLRPWQRAFKFDGVRNVAGRELFTDGPRLADRQCVLVGERYDCDGVDLAGEFRGATHHAIVLGGKGRVTNWRLAGKVSGQRLTPLYRANCDDGDASQLEGA